MPADDAGQTAAYHLEELRIVLDRQNPKCILPPDLPAHCKVLDVGCGAGQTLIAAYNDRHSFGIDVDLNALKLGQSLTPKVSFVCGRAEALPFPSGCFDAVLARGSLPYTNINASLREIHRVLRSGGLVWMTLHSLSMTWARMKQSSWLNRLYCSYILINGICLHLIGKEFGVCGRRESFQTRPGISKALQNSGFADVSVKIDRHFVVVAKKI